nr:HD domain-containing protein [Clostridium algifaecis]
MMSIYDLYLNIEYHLLNDLKPSGYLKEVYNEPLFQKYPFDMLYKLEITEQSQKYHPEGSVWNHTLLVLDEASKVKMRSKNQKVFMWTALLHDIGKYSTTKNRKGKITSYNHDKVGAEMSHEFLSHFTEDKKFIDEVYWLIFYHMQILFVVNSLPFAYIHGMKEHTDIHEVALLGLCDRIGRLKSDRKKEEDNIKRFLKMCK